MINRRKYDPNLSLFTPNLIFFPTTGGNRMLESEFQTTLIRRLRSVLPGSIVIKNDPSYIQGFPDLLVLYKDRWAALEVKKSATAKARPNQRHYVDLLATMSFARFVYPENVEEVLSAIQQAFRS